MSKSPSRKQLEKGVNGEGKRDREKEAKSLSKAKTFPRKKKISSSKRRGLQKLIEMGTSIHGNRRRAHETANKNQKGATEGGRTITKRGKKNLKESPFTVERGKGGLCAKGTHS